MLFIVFEAAAQQQPREQAVGSNLPSSGVLHTEGCANNVSKIKPVTHVNIAARIVRACDQRAMIYARSRDVSPNSLFLPHVLH